MTKEGVEEYVSKNATKFIQTMELDKWKIKFHFEEWNEQEEKNVRSLGYCERLYEYENATITFFWNMFDDEEELRSIFIHELCHLIVSPFDIHHNAIYPLLNKKQKEVAERMYDVSQEKTVVKLQDIFCKLL